MSQEATSRLAHSGITSLSSVGSGSDSDDSSIDIDDFIWDFIFDDLMEERIKEQVVAQLLHGADPEQRRKIEAQREETRAKMELQLMVSAQREEARAREKLELTKSRNRALKEYTNLLGTDVSGYTDPQREEYERELERLVREFFGKDG